MIMLDPVHAMYIEVPGYQSHNDVALAPPPEAGSISTPILQSEYTDSLWDWFVKNIWSANEKPSVDLGEVIP
jgi:hypothetical protein